MTDSINSDTSRRPPPGLLSRVVRIEPGEGA